MKNTIRVFMLLGILVLGTSCADINLTQKKNNASTTPPGGTGGIGGYVDPLPDVPEIELSLNNRPEIVNFILSSKDLSGNSINLTTSQIDSLNDPSQNAQAYIKFYNSEVFTLSQVPHDLSVTQATPWVETVGNVANVRYIIKIVIQSEVIYIDSAQNQFDALKYSNQWSIGVAQLYSARINITYIELSNAEYKIKFKGRLLKNVTVVGNLSLSEVEIYKKQGSSSVYISGSKNVNNNFCKFNSPGIFPTAMCN